MGVYRDGTATLPSCATSAIDASGDKVLVTKEWAVQYPGILDSAITFRPYSNVSVDGVNNFLKISESIAVNNSVLSLIIYQSSSNINAVSISRTTIYELNYGQGGNLTKWYYEGSVPNTYKNGDLFLIPNTASLSGKNELWFRYTASISGGGGSTIHILNNATDKLFVKNNTLYDITANTTEPVGYALRVSDSINAPTMQLHTGGVTSSQTPAQIDTVGDSALVTVGYLRAKGLIP
jgi:hypothetical protein